MDKQRKNPLIFAQNIKALPIRGGRFFSCRELPELVKRYVNGTKTLDYGCGSGEIPVYLKSLGLDVEGVDINEHMIKYAKELDPCGKYRVIESANVPTDDESYDFVYSGFVLPHAKNKLELNAIVKEIARVLKPGGVFINATSHKNIYKCKMLHEDCDFEENRNLYSGSVVKLGFHDYEYTTYHHYWTPEDYREAISEAGLDLLCEHEPIGKDTDGFQWISEKEVPIITMHVTRKHDTKK